MTRLPLATLAVLLASPALAQTAPPANVTMENGMARAVTPAGTYCYDATQTRPWVPCPVSDPNSAASSRAPVTYQMLTNASTSGAVQAGIQGGGYIFDVTGTFGGTTATLNVTNSAGVLVSTSTCTAACTLAVNIAQGSSAQVVLSGGTPTGMYARLGGLGGPLVGLTTPLATYIVTPAATVACLTGTSTGAQTVGPWSSQSGRPIYVELRGTTWPGGTAQLTASSTGAQADAVPLRPADTILGTQTGFGVDQPWTENRTGISFYEYLPGTGITYRICN